MMPNHTIDKFNMMNNYLMYQYGIFICFGLIMTGCMPEIKNDKSSNTHNGKK